MVHRLPDLIDNRQAGVGAFAHRQRLELDIPDLCQLAGRIERIEQAATHAAHCRNFQLAGADLLAERCVAQFFGTVERRRCAIDLEADRAD